MSAFIGFFRIGKWLFHHLNLNERGKILNLNHRKKFQLFFLSSVFNGTSSTSLTM